MFNLYTIGTTVWTAIPRDQLDPSVASTSRVFHDGLSEYAKLKLLPIAGGVPEEVVYQISTSRCDALGKALLSAQGQLILTSPRRLTCSAVNTSSTLDGQIDQEVARELQLYVNLLASLETQSTMLQNWAA